MTQKSRDFLIRIEFSNDTAIETTSDELDKEAIEPFKRLQDSADEMCKILLRKVCTQHELRRIKVEGFSYSSTLRMVKLMRTGKI